MQVTCNAFKFKSQKFVINIVSWYLYVYVYMNILIKRLVKDRQSLSVRDGQCGFNKAPSRCGCQGDMFFGGYDFFLIFV